MELISKEQFLANAELNAQEFQNRQILIVGSGKPDFEAPNFVEYEDESTNPSTRYRKTGPGIGLWTDISLKRLLGIGEQQDGPWLLNADDSTDGVSFSITIPNGLTGHLRISLQGYGVGSTLANVIGGCPGQLITIKRGETDTVQILANDTIKLSAVMGFNDQDHLDNITLQRLDNNKWYEISRTVF